MMTRLAPLSSLLVATMLLSFAPACSKNAKDLVTLGDAAAGASAGEPITVGQLLMNAGGFLDKTVKLKAELGEKGNVVDGYARLTVVSASGPFELRVADKYQPALDKLKPNDTFIAIGQIATAGSEANPRMVFQVD